MEGLKQQIRKYLLVIAIAGVVILNHLNTYFGSSIIAALSDASAYSNNHTYFIDGICIIAIIIYVIGARAGGEK